MARTLDEIYTDVLKQKIGLADIGIKINKLTNAHLMVKKTPFGKMVKEYDKEATFRATVCGGLAYVHAESNGVSMFVYEGAGPNNDLVAEIRDLFSGVQFLEIED